MKNKAASAPQLKKLSLPKMRVIDPMKGVSRANYRYWRIRILAGIVMGYALFYLVRANFSIAMPCLQKMGYTKTQLGDILFFWSSLYGVGKFVNGYFSDRSNARYFMTIGLVGAAIFSLLVAWNVGYWSLLIVLLCNSWFQSMGWPPAARMLTHWFSPTELGTKWALGAASHQIGGAVIMIGGGYLVAHYGWESVFIIPSILCLGGAILLFTLIRDNPSEEGLPAVEHYKGDHFHDDGDTKPLSHQELWRRVLSNRLLWIVCFGNLFVYIVRMGVLHWAPMFLSEYKGVQLQMAGWQAGFYEIAGLFGGVSAGWVSDKLFKGRRGPVATFYMIALFVAIIVFWKTPAGYRFLDTITLFLVGFLVYGPQVLVGVASADFASKKAVGTANGLAGAFASFGSALSGACVGRLTEAYGWNGGFTFFAVAALCGAFCFSLTWHQRAVHLRSDKVA